MKTLPAFFFMIVVHGQMILAQTPNPGPYYFVSDIVGGNQFYGNKDSYSGVVVIEGYNLLAHVLGDVPRASGQQRLVAPAVFDYGPDTIHLQPFAFTTPGNSRKRNLPKSGSPSAGGDCCSLVCACD